MGDRDRAVAVEGPGAGIPDRAPAAPRLVDAVPHQPPGGGSPLFRYEIVPYPVHDGGVLPDPPVPNV